MKKYRGILFDLFATLALWHPDKLPRFTYRGKTTPSTMGELQVLVNEIVDKASFDDFYLALTEVNEIHAEHKERHSREISSRERFLAVLERLGYVENEESLKIAEQLSLRHMELLASVVKIPAEYDQFLRELAAHYRLALVSNFDHHPTAHRILKRDGIHSHFDHVVISDEHGFRKPHRKIFEDAIGHLSLPTEEVLFVGDSWGDDVVGAQEAGIDVAWVNPKNKPHATSGHKPTLEISSVLDLREHLL
ncbi:MAG: HAD family hydrolase [Gammaproteobacteria bacterium]